MCCRGDVLSWDVLSWGGAVVGCAVVGCAVVGSSVTEEAARHEVADGKLLVEVLKTRARTGGKQQNRQACLWTGRKRERDKKKPKQHPSCCTPR
eukprot:4077853-Prymnesium_polylepis.1